LSERNNGHPPKVVIIGAGYVGSSFAYALMIQGIVSEIVLIDRDEDKAKGEALDLEHGVSFVYPSRIWAGNFKDCTGADIVVVTAGHAQKPGESRLALVRENVEIFRQIIPQVVKYNQDCIILVATNPVDIMTYTALKLSSFHPSKVIGSGTILDTSRLRYRLAEFMEVDARNVHAYIIGEHGDSEVPLWSTANIAGVRIKDYCPLCEKELEPELMNRMFNEVKNAAYEIIRFKGRTNFAIGLGLTRIVESIVRDENAILTVSSLLQDYYGVSDVCISVPAIVNKKGIRDVLKLPLEEVEVKKFQESASILKNVIKSLGLTNDHT
jgi:L-lactate dehydrogenase